MWLHLHFPTHVINVGLSPLEIHNCDIDSAFAFIWHLLLAVKRVAGGDGGAEHVNT